MLRLGTPDAPAAALNSDLRLRVIIELGPLNAELRLQLRNQEYVDILCAED